MKELDGLNLGVALCGSFCTFAKAIKAIEDLTQLGINVFPIMSFNAYEISTRFGEASDIISRIETITQKKIIHTLADAEPLGPKNIIDAILIAPCTGNTLAKLNFAITDTPVLLATKSLMRNGKPVILSLATNDGLGSNLKNIGGLFNKKNVYFVPLGQDDPIKKPYSLVSDFSQIQNTLSMALSGKQIQPVLITY
ncbi:MAG: dipicolinate synthase subunit B [Candidatus Cellulosilyticum pullistercoris]|uniref:Dipicolinate synthase subunit B n=1 Tax=Candidatus Cellulosilyticum pullistercoris TaxID=2838521 RepID=A0A9E2KDA4_9FIRM|nr:dipicolinate synthase subunit B [Candidatus Cellulosilyticum pullistercoris]